MIINEPTAEGVLSNFTDPNKLGRIFKTNGKLTLIGEDALKGLERVLKGLEDLDILPCTAENIMTDFKRVAGLTK